MADLHEQPQLVGLSERWSGAFGSPLRTTVLTSPIVEITIAFKFTRLPQVHIECRTRDTERLAHRFHWPVVTPPDASSRPSVLLSKGHEVRYEPLSRAAQLNPESGVRHVIVPKLSRSRRVYVLPQPGHPLSTDGLAQPEADL